MDKWCVSYNFSKARYKAYLKTQIWAGKRERAWRLAEYQCEKCGLKPPESSYLPTILHVHHLTYKRLGYERVEDLMVLCRNCHKKTHGLK